MQMTEAEIVKSYQRADKKREQIKILAELNACQKQVIRDILEKHGEEVPKTGNRYTIKKPEVTEANGSKRKKKTTDCKDCAREKSCGYRKPNGEHCEAFVPKGSEGSKVSAQGEVGTKSEKVTNGDMIKALYPNIEEERIEDIINIYSLCEHSVTFDTEWWDNPYFAGKENESEGEE